MPWAKKDRGVMVALMCGQVEKSPGHPLILTPSKNLVSRGGGGGGFESILKKTLYLKANLILLNHFH